MDELIRHFDAAEDDDLMLCRARGVAYQRDMAKRVSYGDAYFANYVKLAGTPIAKRLNAGRVDLVNRHVGAHAPVLDVGIGSGEFIRSRRDTFGTDVNPVALKWLNAERKLSTDFDRFRAFTFWDVLEHVDVPNVYFKRMAPGSHLFASLPVFRDLGEIRASKHYKPGEHLYYWTVDGFVEWMAGYRFRLVEYNHQETEAGREGIGSFAFVRDLPDYRQTLDQYKEIHARAYGVSAYLYFDQIAKEVVNLRPGSILDYGCGRSDMVAHFWNEGRRRIAKYDPAIPQFEQMPGGEFDLVLCTDVMEHIQIADIDRVLSEIRAKSANALFTISMKPARARLPDGRNAHVSLLTASEWTRWVKSRFGRAFRIPTQWEHILMLKTFG